MNQSTPPNLQDVTNEGDSTYTPVPKPSNEGMIIAGIVCIILLSIGVAHSVWKSGNRTINGASQPELHRSK